MKYCSYCSLSLVKIYVFFKNAFVISVYEFVFYVFSLLSLYNNDFEISYKYIYICKKGLMGIFLTQKRLWFVSSLIWCFCILIFILNCIKHLYNNIFYILWYIALSYFLDCYSLLRNVPSKTGSSNIFKIKHGPYYS